MTVQVMLRISSGDSSPRIHWHAMQLITRAEPHDVVKVDARADVVGDHLDALAEFGPALAS